MSDPSLSTLRATTTVWGEVNSRRKGECCARGTVILNYLPFQGISIIFAMSHKGNLCSDKTNIPRAHWSVLGWFAFRFLLIQSQILIQNLNSMATIVLYWFAYRFLLMQKPDLNSKFEQHGYNSDFQLRGRGGNAARMRDNYGSTREERVSFCYSCADYRFSDTVN